MSAPCAHIFLLLVSMCQKKKTLEKLKWRTKRSFAVQLSVASYPFYSLFAWLTLVALIATLWLFLVCWKVGRTLRERLRWHIGRNGKRRDANHIVPYMLEASPSLFYFSIHFVQGFICNSILWSTAKQPEGQCKSFLLFPCLCVCKVNKGHNIQIVLSWHVRLFVYLSVRV